MTTFQGLFQGANILIFHGSQWMKMPMTTFASQYRFFGPAMHSEQRKSALSILSTPPRVQHCCGAVAASLALAGGVGRCIEALERREVLWKHWRFHNPAATPHSTFAAQLQRVLAIAGESNYSTKYPPNAVDPQKWAFGYVNAPMAVHDR
ncbi:hypothetical protein E4U12_000797 [Claviceps purpurea]|nr:hypothetical protein E4U12_000797 [Claviceps purpurea]